MSGDLISRSALMQSLRGNVLVDVTTNLEQAIEEQPTAYDVDKVVEQLEERIKNFKSLNSDRHNFCGTVTDEHCFKYNVCESCMAEQICKVVKSGGIE